MGVRYTDSVEKIKSYLEVVSAPSLKLSRMFFRDYTCPENCGGCCPRFSLDYVDGPRWEKFKSTYPQHVHRFIDREVDGVMFHSDFQKDNEGHWCRYVKHQNGRCLIHEANPFSCEFEILKLMVVKGESILTKKLFGRGWQLLKVDGERGALCKMLPFDPSKIQGDISLLKELEYLAGLFGVETSLPHVIEFLQRNSHHLDEGRIPNRNIKFSRYSGL